MTLDQLKYFVAVARVEHVGRAAKSASISASVISATISSLEEELGCKLFKRKSNRIFLTVSGDRLWKESEKLLTDASLLKKKVNDDKVGLQGQYRIGASHFLASDILTPTWAKLSKDNPELKAEVLSLDSSVVTSDVLSGRIDAGLVFSPIKHQNLSEIEIYRGVLLICVRRGHPILRMNEQKRIKNITRFPYTTFRASLGANICESHPVFDKFGIVPKSDFYYDNDYVALQRLLSTDSWCFWPDIIVKSFSKKVVPLFKPKNWDAPITISIIRNKKSGPDTGLDQLIEAVKNQTQEKLQAPLIL